LKSQIVRTVQFEMLKQLSVGDDVIIDLHPCEKYIKALMKADNMFQAIFPDISLFAVRKTKTST